MRLFPPTSSASFLQESFSCRCVDKGQPTEICIDVGIIMEKSQEIVHPRIASMEQIKLLVFAKPHEVLQINRRCVIHGAQSRANLNYQTMFSRQSANVVNHIFSRSPCGCFCGVLHIGGSTALLKFRTRSSSQYRQLRVSRYGIAGYTG